MDFEKMRYKPVRKSEARILKCAEIVGGCANFLDIGCGDGKLTVKFASKLGFCNIYGIDNDRKKIIEAINNGVKAEYTDINIERLPFLDKTIGCVLCNQTAEHLLNVDNMMEEAWRVLKPNGYLVISIPNLCSLHNRFFMLLGYQPTVISPSTKFSFGNPIQNGQKLKTPFDDYDETIGHRHNNAFSPKALRRMLEHYNFKIEYYWGAGIYFLPELIIKLFPELGVDQIVLARKIE